MKISPSEVLPAFVDIYPGCREHFIKEADYWIDEKGAISVHSLFSIFSSLVVERFLLGEYERSEDLFGFIDLAIKLGDKEVANAAYTCFLENLINIASTKADFELSHFWSLLGPLATEFADNYMTENF
ncbi:DUF7674 family protein [Vibrio parahaemolyticus]|uniref:DUF7674 family protein n=1 Tax=Vibrio parahaemolyticus TaxID=670 RepID=UPI001122F940|nr:hypothetical protein [Vibrio parahaemolyticus]MCC4219257.1 hypothetical protein [Vibrio parahaemolyticus]TOI84609.1 hypothetical protein CGI51_23595 [Vibrio parahaemolyticus]